MPGSITWAAKSRGIVRLDQFLETPSESLIPQIRDTTDIFRRSPPSFEDSRANC